jgi:hypothetical protein
VCPEGAHFDGRKCVLVLDPICPASEKFVPGRGCVPVAPVPVNKFGPKPEVMHSTPSTASPAPETPPKEKGGSFRAGFTIRLQGNCAGVPIEVHGGARFTGVKAMLLIDGKKAGDEVNVNIGQTKNVEQLFGSKKVNLKVQQGVWGARYTVTVDGVECKLSN